MKRRNADCGKIRRPIKRNKIAEGMYGSTTILYMKFLILWAIVITADFMFMFRFEFLWPFWLLLRSVHDSFKYKGLAFSVLFVCIAITSDLVCLFFIPVHWLLFAASTYVWVQYVWHTDKGICLPTIILWMLFVYLEAGIRWKDSRHMPHLDLCRPFAAHCIGYPVVTLGFGFKSYVGYRMRQRKQREVAKENEFYMQLLQQALPQDEALDDLQNISANGSVVVSTVSSTLGSTTGPGSAQTVHANSIAADHHSSSHHGDDKNHIGHLNSSQVTAIQHTASLPNNHHHQHHHHNNFNNSSSGSSNRNAQTNSKINHVSNSVTTATANGHVGNSLNSSMTAVSSSKSQRRSADKDKNDSNQHHSSNSSNLQLSTNKSANHVSNNSHSADSGTHNGNSSNTLKSSATSNSSYLNHVSSSQSSQKESKDKDSWDNCSSSTTSSASSNSSVHSSKDGKVYPNNYEMTNGNHSSFSSSGPDKKNQPNGNIAQYEVEEVVPEPVEKVKGRRNRSKRDTQGSSKDNHSNHNTNNTSQQQHQNNHSHNNSQQNHSQQQHKDSTTSLDSITSSSSSLSSTAAAAAATISNVASQIVSKVCETCLRLETEIKKYRNEISHMKQIENELRQKLESNAINKSCLQAKQRENDEMEKRLQELQSCRQTDFINLQNAERRLTEERRQRQSLESLLNNEKKARKLAEEKANRAECSEQCKQRKMQIEQENKQLRRELKSNEEAKQVAEQQGRKFEQELRMFEAEIRNREAQQGTEVLMSALAAMQDKNSTLEKNLSAETRVKLDLFSALGEAKRQLEIKDSMVRNKDDEVLDLKAKIAQLLAVMPTDSLCLPQCSNTGSSMLRMNDTPPLQGPSSPIMSLGGPTHQLMAAAAAAAHQQQMNSRGGSGMVSNVVAVVTSASGVTNVVSSSVNGNNNSNVLTQTSSNLDPNATAYTPKNSSLVGGAEA